MDVNAIQQWTRNAFLVPGDGGRGTGAGFEQVTIVATWTGVQFNTTASWRFPRFGNRHRISPISKT
jgi:hypothetical protein